MKALEIDTGVLAKSGLTFCVCTASNDANCLLLGRLATLATRDSTRPRKDQPNTIITTAALASIVASRPFAHSKMRRRTWEPSCCSVCCLQCGEANDAYRTQEHYSFWSCA